MNSFQSQENNTEEVEKKGKEQLRIIYTEHLTSLIERFKRYAGSSIPSFSFSTDGNVDTAVFRAYRDGRPPEIVIGLDFFIKNNLTLKQAEWVMLHELTHFKDYAKDKAQYMSMSEKCEKWGQELTDKLSNYYKETYNEELPEIRKRMLRDKLAKIYSSGYVNVMDDIWVNHSVQEDDDFEEGNEGDKEREDLYKKVLSPNRILSYHDFESYQFLYACLRGENVNEGFRITERTQEALGRDYRLLGQTVNTKQIIDSFLNPGNKEAIIGNRKKTDSKGRHDALNVTLLPTYTELLFNDMKRALDEYHDDPNKDLDKQLDDLIKMFEKMFPDFIPHDVIKSWGKYKEGEKEDAPKTTITSKNINPQGTSHEVVEDESRKWREDNNISEETNERVKQIEEDIKKYLNKLNELWKRISSSVSVERTFHGGGKYKKGKQINVPAFIREYPKVTTGQINDLRVMERLEYIERPVNKPEKIEISLLLDRSRSMFGDNSSYETPKNKAIERVTLLIMKSLERFNRHLNNVREETKTKLKADTEVILYGTHATTRKPFKGSSAIGKDRAFQYKVMEDLKESLGNTVDENALAKVNDYTDKQKVEEIKAGKLLKIVFLITDGASNKRDSLIKQIEDLKRKGVHLYAIQIGDVTEDEVRLFDALWNDGDEKLGFRVGNDLSKLVPAITEMLEKELEDVEI